MLWAALGGGEVALLDVAAPNVTALLRLRTAADDAPAPTATHPPAALDAADGELEAASRGVRVRALAAAGPGAVLLGADDGAVRRWSARDAGAHACTLLCAQRGALRSDGAAVGASWRGVPVLEQRLAPSAAAPPAAAGGAAEADVHADAVTALALVGIAEGAPPLLFAAGRDGAVSVWR